MSVKIMAEVWELDIPQNQKLILLAYADHADDAGICFPGIARVAWKTCYSEREVKRICGQLRASGLLETISREDVGRGKARVYRVRTEKGVKMTPFILRKGDIQSTERVTSEVGKDDIAMSRQPSLTTNQPSHPSVQRSERSATRGLGTGRMGSGLFTQVCDWAEQSWRERFGSKPTWTKKDFVGLARILRLHPELGLDEFKTRWGRYLADSDPFVAKQGHALAFFCSRFDSYMDRSGSDIPLATPYEDRWPNSAVL